MDFATVDKELQFEMLKCLKKKDYRDVSCSVLVEHYKWALKYQKDYPLEIFVPYIMCPRAYYEQLTAYREFISSVFDKHRAELFREQPKLVWEYVSKLQLDLSRYHEQLIGTPEGIIRSGITGLKGRKVLFTAICRTFGIPARINPMDLAVQYYEKGEFRNLENDFDEDKGNAGLILMGGTEKWFYLNNWTIAVLKEGTYQTLELADYPWENGQLELALKPGSYRLITSNRTPNGNQFAKKYCFKLEEGHEPTEHILNEFIQAQDVLNRMDCSIIFIIPDHNALGNETFKKACRTIPGAKVYYSDFFDTAETMARRMYVDPENLPLTVVAQCSRGIYACSGYNVGIVGLIIKIMNL